MALLIRRVFVDPLWPTGRSRDRVPLDVRIEGDRIAGIARDLGPGSDDEVLDGRGGVVIPGLHDHHVHLSAWAAAAQSVEVGPPAVTTAEALRARLRGAPGAPGSWIRATGYHQSVAGDLDRAVLDRLEPTRPVRIQHRSGALWILNSRALEALGLDRASAGGPTAAPGVERDPAGHPTGRLWRADRWLADRLGGPEFDLTSELSAISRRAAAVGVTGFTDATPDLDATRLETLLGAQAGGGFAQRLCLMSASAFEPTALATRGPRKVLLDDDRLPQFDSLVDTFRDTHRSGAPVAVHCVTRAQAVLTVAALEEAVPVPGDRIEHGAILGADLLPTVRRLGAIVVTQPGFVRARGDTYLDEVDADDLGDLWRLRSLLEAGVAVAMSTDAPFGPADPWLAIDAASTRSTLEGRTVSGGEAIERRRALALFCGEPARPDRLRVVAPGAVADLVVLGGPLPRDADGQMPEVAATIVAGRVVHGAGLV